MVFEVPDPYIEGIIFPVGVLFLVRSITRLKVYDPSRHTPIQNLIEPFPTQLRTKCCFKYPNDYILITATVFTYKCGTNAIEGPSFPVKFLPPGEYEVKCAGRRVEVEADVFDR